MGVGKTTVCRRLKVLLPNSVFLDGDWCWDMHPFQITEETKAMVLDNICHLLYNFLGCSAFQISSSAGSCMSSPSGTVFLRGWT